MEINGDGRIDILSGSYSRQTADMAGLFQVLAGAEGGGFEPAEALKGTDGEPLVIGTKDQMMDRICTRPFAADMNADGNLDLVVGNFQGTFFMFRGLGSGEFAPDAEKMMVGGDGDKALTVALHSDPFVVDWDGDGDLDLLSGTANGGVMMSENRGTAASPAFAAFTELVAPMSEEARRESMMGTPKLGDAHITGPQGSTRVWAADVDNDGDLDLLVGDSVTLYHAGNDSVTPEQAVAALEAFRSDVQSIFATQPQPDGDSPEAMAEWEEKIGEWQKKYEARIAERDKIVREDMTGFVWFFERQ